MRTRGLIAWAIAGLVACAPQGAPVGNWFSETFALGAPLRDPVGALGTAWSYYDGGATSQYAKLVNARNPGAEVHDTAGRSGSPALYSSDTTAGRTMYTTWALVGTAGSRALSPVADAGVVVLDFYIQFVGANPSSGRVYLYSSPSIYASDLNLQFYNATTFKVALTFAVPNGGGVFGVTDDYDVYSIGASDCWRNDGLWHHVRVEGRAGTITTWTPGTFNDENDYTGGDLVVASDGWLKLYLDDAEVLALTGVPFIMNFDGQDANESSPGSWVTAARLVEANVNRLSLFEVGIVGASFYIDDITVGGAETWVPIADFEEHPLDAAQYPGGTARAVCELWVGGVGSPVGSPLPTIQPRLVSLLTTRDADGLLEVDAEVGRGDVMQADQPTDATFGVTLAGIKRHRLEVTSDTPGARLWCAPGADVRI